MRFTFQLFIGLLFVKWNFAQHNPLKDPNICGLPECKGTGKFKYKPGTQQNYQYSVEVKTLFNGTSKNESNLYVQGNVALSFFTPCDGLLTLSDMTISETSPTKNNKDSIYHKSQQFDSALSEYYVRFAFKDGTITELCPADEENIWILNFKRGILSMLHNTMKRFDLDHSTEEEDVQGKCPTRYTVLGANGTSLLIKKVKDLNSCQKRSKFHSVLQTTTNFNFESNNKNDKILKSSSDCYLSIDHNIYNDITCKEVHILQPFSNKEAGLTTSVVQKLTLVREEITKEEMNPDVEVTRRTDLVFDHALQPKLTHGELKTSRDLIKQLCKRNRDDAQFDLSDIFSKLIRSLRLLSYPALSALYGHSRATCPTGRKHLLDVLPFVNTAASVAVIRDIILKEKVPESTVDEWVISMAFISNPNENIMETVANLLQRYKFSPVVALSVSSLTHSYCIHHSNCQNNEAVSSIVEYLERRFSKLVKMNYLERNNYDEIMVTIKALSNIGVMSEEFQQELFRVIENDNLDIGLRVAAVDSFRRLSCEDTRSDFEYIFRNQEEDAEVRIASYLQIMRCPNYLLIRTIRHALLYEEVNQVGSFIWTHLNNLLKTSVPNKVEIQSLLSEKDLVKKFSTDIRKFSHNFEGSLYFDEYNMGGSYESNLIYSTSSYIPKSAMLNLTVDVFGESINMFEINGRLEGFEHYLESFFGPKGTSKETADSIVKSVRKERDTRADETLKRQIDTIPNVMDNLPKEPRAFLGVKIFGNELKYTSFRGKEEIWNAIETLNPVYHLKRVFSGKEISYNKAVMFLDCNYVVPTGAGLPLSLTALGTSSINVKLHGSLKAAGFSKDKELEMDLNADIQPTVSVDIAGEMSVDAFYYSTGAKLKTNMYTDSAVNATVRIRGTKLVSVKFSLPRQRNEIFGARSELLLKRNNIEEKQSGISSSTSTKSICSWPSVDKTIGLKVCAQYNYIDVTVNNNAPHFLLAGPAGLRWYIDKSDPTANIYLFEYKWTHRRDSSVISVVFDTPGSEIKRVLNGNFTIDRQSQNLTMLLQSSAGTILARGRYKNTENEKFIQLALDINDKKHFDASMSLVRSQIRNGFSYKPKVYIGVNGERVVKMDGSIDSMSKKGISQYTVDLKFETKRLISKLFGYISKSESSLEVRLYQDYKFQNTKEHRNVIKFGIANRSHKNLIVVIGFCNLNTTAYPNLNFESNATFQRSGSHIELGIKLNQKPLSSDPDAESKTLKFDSLFSYTSFTDNKRALKMSAAVSRKSSNLDLKGEFIYESFRYDLNMAALVKYGTNKEVIATVYWSHPRATLEQIKTHINITIPSFTPMVLKVDIEEKHPKDYMIDIEATWFSGHRLSTLGFYQDKRTPSSSNHHIKLFLTSPSFQDAHVDLQYYRDNEILKVDFSVLHSNNTYQLFLHHQTISAEETRTTAKINYKEKLYRFLSTVYDGDYKKIHTELRIDQIRDIDFSIWIYNLDAHKAFGFEINWDANRDPDQKLLISANYTKIADFHHTADFILSYPSRTIIGEYLFFLHRRNISTLASLSWDDGNTFAIDLGIQYGNEGKLFLDFSSKLRTPFENWKLMKLDGLFEHFNNKYVINGMMAWDKGQRVAVDVFGDYMTNESIFTCKYSCSIASSLSHIPNINTTISHVQNETNFNSVLHLMYNPDFIIDLDSQWMVESDKDSTNLTGTIHSQTPFKGLNKGVLVSKIFLQNTNKIKGIAQLDLDNRKMMVNLDGKFFKITNCMLVVNVTTPIEDYQLLFKSSAEERHFIALLSYPTGNLGAEVLFSVNSLTNFDTRLYVATPIEFLQKIIIAAKLVPHEADFRVGWNLLLVGFSGVWNYVNYTNFEYACKIYTPIEDFEENGFVAKLIVKEGLDSELSVKLSNYKLGVKLLGQPKLKPLQELGIEVRNVYLRSKVSQMNKKYGDDPLSWKGLLELDIIIYPTIKGELEIEQKGYSYVLQSKMILPHGMATVYDEFEYIDVFSMKNDMRITTPYKSFKTISSNFNFNVETGKKYIFLLDMDYENDTRTIKTGLQAKYLSETTELDRRAYNATLNLNTPFKAFPKLNLFGAFETEDNYYHTVFILKTNRSDVSLDATAEIVGSLLEVNSKMNVVTPSIYVPPCEIRLTKLFSYTNNYIETIIHMPEKLQSDIYLKTSWLIKSQTEFRSMVQLETPFTGLENTSAGVEVYVSNARSTLSFTLQMNPLDVDIKSTLQNNVLTATSLLNFNRKRFPVSVNCKILKPSRDTRQFDGELKLKDKLFKISGSADVIGGIPTRVAIKFTPKDNTPPLRFEYQIESTAVNQYKIVGNVQHSDRFTNFNAHLSTTDKFNWEFNLEIEPSNSSQITMHSRAYSDDTSKNLLVEARTPIISLEHPKLGATYTFTKPKHTVHGFFEVTKAKGTIDMDLVWVFLENMYAKAVGRYENDKYSSESYLEAIYENPRKEFQFVKAGADVKVGIVWEAGANVTLNLQNTKEIEGHLKVPDDNRETHSIYGNVNYTKNFRNTDYLLKYRTAYSLRKYGLWGKVLTEDVANVIGDTEVEWDSKRYHNFANFKGSKQAFDFIYKLKTPKYIDKNFLVTELNFVSLNDYHNLTSKIFYPEDRSVAYAAVDYKELDNMNGTLNITVPHRSFNYTGADFVAKTNEKQHNRYLKVFWDGGNAVLDSKCDIKTQTRLSEKNMKGVLVVEVPLATRHVALVNYEYDEKPKNSMGHAVVNYNGSNVLDGTYNRKKETRFGRSKDTIHVELHNKMIPVGADYTHTEAYDGQNKNYNTSTLDNKHLHLYHLKNQTKFNLTGELSIRTTQSGQEHIFKATHANRTVKLWNDYDILDREYRQHSRIELSPTTWIEYDLNLFNKTTDEIFDAQQVVVNVFYPRRNFTAQGFYNISDSIVSTDASLVWDKDKKTVQLGMDWRRSSHHREQLSLEIKHPSFERDVTLFSDYGYNKTSIDGKLFVDYSLNSDQRLTLSGRLSDNSNLNLYNYSYIIWAEHNSTNLVLDTRGDFYWNSRTFGTEHFTNYQRSYLPLTSSVALARTNFDRNEIEIKKESATTGLSYFFGTYGGEFPVYTANMSAAHGTNDTAGEFYVNLKNKLLYLNINMTEDGSQSVHMYGFIPDVRSAVFDIWRDYEDKRVSDVSYYLRLNHSRLIMSRLQWRPELIGDVQSGIRSSIMQFYLNTLESINNTRQYIRTETSDAIHGIWMDAKPNINQFLSDLRNLSVIESDIEELKLFLNKSYHNNEFYMRDIATAIVTMFDELALKSHLQSLPTIVQEIWSVMGESGQKIKRGILWVIEKVKVYYKNTTDFIHGLINGDPVEHMSKLFETLVEKYDNFIKSVHVSVIQYMESLWSQTYTLVVEHWHKTLAAIEPTFLKFVHYLESIVWNTGKEFLDFLYLRKHEIVESPYFVKFTKFTHDIDRFYKDITGKNTIASIYKYITITWNFLKEKYISTIPFGKELSAIVNEIWMELKQVGNIPSIKYFINKCHEAYDYAKYYYNYFDVENRIHKVVTLIYIKLSDMSVTALEAENRQRVAKTKFIFEPDDGIMLLEQKLPMPWHAFNETPKFKEIPEIKAVYDLQKYLEVSKLSFWNLYYDYKPFLHPSEWFPPFKGQAMLIGTKYYVTFDRTYYEFYGRCTYLLATDFVDRNFTLLVSDNGSGSTNELILVLNKTVVHINMFNKRIEIGGVGMNRLPLQIGDSYLYQDADILTVMDNTGFILECNMKFHICTFEVSGWYFGKTAGLWGTYNNEPSDDFMTSSKVRVNTSALNVFGNSWTLDKRCKTDVIHRETSAITPQNVYTLCQEFFTSKISQLSACFQRVPKQSFLSMCLNSRTEEEACMSAVSYINLCSYTNVPLRIPDTCVKCNLLNGTEIKEGDFIRLQGNAVPQTVDIVFIVEAKKCNKDLIKSKNFDTIVELLDKELNELNVTGNRFAVVIFGGDGVYDEPRSIILNGNTFTDSKSVVNYFNNLPIGDGNQDIFNAIIFAYNLIFRPGVARSFILLPCSECNKYNMDHDYSTIHQLLSEGSVSLHIIMNEYFTMQKEREIRIPFGIDRRYAYTKRDMRTLVGDQSLRKSIALPKSTLGICLSLTMETNGTVFSGKHLETDKKNAKKFSTVFAKAVARKSLPRQCADCECTAPNSGVSYMECYQCTMTNLTRSNIEHHVLGFEDEDVFNNMNVFDGFSF